MRRRTILQQQFTNIGSSQGRPAHPPLVELNNCQRLRFSRQGQPTSDCQDERAAMAPARNTVQQLRRCLPWNIKHGDSPVIHMVFRIPAIRCRGNGYATNTVILPIRCELKRGAVEHGRETARTSASESCQVRHMDQHEPITEKPRVETISHGSCQRPLPTPRTTSPARGTEPSGTGIS